MKFTIDERPGDNWAKLFSSFDRYSDGGIYEAVLLTPHGFVWCQSVSKEAQGDCAQTVLYFARDNRIFRAVIKGKQYKPRGMQKLAQEFAGQCVSK